MSIFKCKMCGGTIEFEQGSTIGVCDHCGTKQTLPHLDDDKIANLYDRANHFRRNNDFDKAMSIYEQILNENTTDAEAYWSLVLCRYGIEYVEDPASHRRIPTINRAQFTSILADEDYKAALHHADIYQKTIYEDEAKAIDDIQKGILAISQREEPFDVFICYKETDNDGRRTPDSVLATELYHELTKEGFKVFFSRITLEDKLGTAYEPYIFAALNSSKVMVVLGTKQEYFNAVWVRNEWSRYLALVKNSDGKKMLIPAYRDMDPYDLPEEFSYLQAQDMSKLGFMQDLTHGIKKIIEANAPNGTVKKTIVGTNNVTTPPALLLERVFLFLEDGKWQDANIYCEKVLDIDPKNAEAYLGKLMAELHVKTRKQLIDCAEPFNTNDNFVKIIRFGDEKLENEMRDYITSINERNENTRLTRIYNNAKNTMNAANTERAFNLAARSFATIPNFKDADALRQQCLDKAESCRWAVARKAKELSEKTKKKAKKRRITVIVILLCIIGIIIFLLMKSIIYNDLAPRGDLATEPPKSTYLNNEPTICATLLPTPEPTSTQTFDPEPTLDENYYTRSGEYIYFGSYPQSEVTDESLKLSLTSAAGSTSNWTSYDYYVKGKISAFMKYKDVTYNGNKYRGVYFIQYRPYFNFYDGSNDYSYQDDNGYYKNTIYWFKYEPIKWKILLESTSEVFLVSEMIIDSQDYNHTEDNNYESSSIRGWLNSSFCTVAFNNTELGNINTTVVDNSVLSTGYVNNLYACSNTNDKIFLLSYMDVSDSSNGFGSDSTRIKNLTDYAKSQGAYSSTGRGWWWVRSPFYSSSDRVSVIRDTGKTDDRSASRPGNGIVPALHLSVIPNTNTNIPIEIDSSPKNTIIVPTTPKLTDTPIPTPKVTAKPVVTTIPTPIPTPIKTPIRGDYPRSFYDNGGYKYGVTFDYTADGTFADMGGFDGIGDKTQFQAKDTNMFIRSFVAFTDVIFPEITRVGFYVEDTAEYIWVADANIFTADELEDYWAFMEPNSLLAYAATCFSIGINTSIFPEGAHDVTLVVEYEGDAYMIGERTFTYGGGCFVIKITSSGANYDCVC